MTEIWLNYGPTDLVVDISAENLGDHITSRGEAINGSKLAEKLGAIDTSKGTELAVLHDTPAVRETIVAICSLCEQKSKPIPRIIADADTAASIKGSLPEGSAVSRMDAVSLDATNLVFVSELDPRSSGF